MNRNKGLIRMSLALGVIALTGLFFSALALSDIYHNNEPDLNTEWSMVRFSYLFTLMFIVVSSVTILRLAKK